MKKKITIGIIGFGNMGSAIAFALNEDRGYKVCLFEKDPDKRKRFDFIGDISHLIQKCEIVIFAIKPQDVNIFLQETKADFIKYKPLLISIAAGLTTDYYERRLGKLRVVRVMPNLAAKVKEACSFICKGKYAKNNDVSRVNKIFLTLGQVRIVREELMDAVTALSGSGPGFVFYLMDCFLKGAVELGFKKSEAKKIVAQTFFGAVKLAKLTQKDFSMLVAEVASKGGTTRAGLDVLEQAGLETAVPKALEAARWRAGELARQLS